MTNIITTLFSIVQYFECKNHILYLDVVKFACLRLTQPLGFDKLYYCKLWGIPRNVSGNKLVGVTIQLMNK